ncbi:hypothetical protein AG1IA_10478 [Rhizoctonia solani AG-1 IA]|uniref:Uncharacterized protein n=1 Tax=Thanatephorus cucumeris (strain AG1-IA) TaxID=983506 RepID=L8WFK3_THACA|nr:hypothetical protein AG1IA_10478 [Rhizoctonia solani AG-1 IA]
MRLPCLFLVATSALFRVVSGVDSSHNCATIEVRREWRNLTSTERKAWIDASNCLNTRPRSGKLNPPVNTAVDYPGFFNQIVPINENSTYYDDLVYAYVSLLNLPHICLLNNTL